MIHSSGQVQTVLEGLTLPNGMGWTSDGDTFYLNDSLTGELLAFDFDAQSGSLANRRIIRTFEPSEGLPDGLAVDVQGGIWVSLWGGGKVVRVSPSGDILAIVRVPASQPSSCAFAGPGLRSLYITSATFGLTQPQENDGALFYVPDVDVAGVPVADVDDAAWPTF